MTLNLLMFPRLLVFLLTIQLTVCASPTTTNAQDAVQADDQAKPGFTRQDRLRGTVGPERAWWDVKHYRLDVNVDIEQQTLQGSNTIRFETVKSGQKMQIDLQEPLKITSVSWQKQSLPFERDGNVYWVNFPQPLEKGTPQEVKVLYEGKPVVSKNPPWSGGVSWKKDEKGNPFIATTCQGAGASLWWPNKDHGSDEPDQGMDILINVPQGLTAVSNGRLVNREPANERETFHWRVTQPINNYCVNMNIGNYVNFNETFDGEAGKLDVAYWVLAHQKETALKHFKETPRTLKAFEHWFGPYPFYEDSFKLVVVPYLGMEHQSSVTYGNGFKNGYRGTDLSETGVGMKFDFIIVHESGHEWWGNNVSMKDVADMWIHESFTNYSENLFVEYHFSQKEAQDYVIGCRKRIRNDTPIIGTYGVNSEGSGDMYYKGGNMLHTMRHIINDDEKWRTILRGLNKTFWHQTVTTEQVEFYISEQAGIDFDAYFDQYLRSTKIPKLIYSLEGKKASFKFENVVDGFAYPVRVRINGAEKWIKPSSKFEELILEEDVQTFELDRNFYMECVAKSKTAG